ncbi:uncharacterized protein LOC134842500 [Symsagittifera roscoffensis]|uniref:uncharacterized protein LOC134842500 n=1 Tax=Symsagittifera roscoffensis TaxID=84072 RepID=UPI00307B24E2
MSATGRRKKNSSTEEYYASFVNRPYSSTNSSSAPRCTTFRCMTHGRGEEYLGRVSSYYERVRSADQADAKRQRMAALSSTRAKLRFDLANCHGDTVRRNRIQSELSQVEYLSSKLQSVRKVSSAAAAPTRTNNSRRERSPTRNTAAVENEKRKEEKSGYDKNPNSCEGSEEKRDTMFSGQKWTRPKTSKPRRDSRDREGREKLRAPFMDETIVE